MKQVDGMLKALGVRQYMGPPSSRDCVDGPYVTLESAGPLEGRAYRRGAMAASEEDAVAFFCEELQKWLAGREVVIWRSRPVMETDTLELLGGKSKAVWAVRSSLTAYKKEEFQEILP